MITYYKKEGKEIVEVDSLIQAEWVHLGPDFEHGEIQIFAAENEIPLDFITDSLDIDERSRYEREEDVDLVLINTPVLNDGSKENEAIYITVPIGIILVNNIIVTICSKESPIIKKIISNQVKNANTSDIKLFMLQIFEQNVYSFLECLKKLNLKRNLMEDELYHSSRNKELQQLLRIEKSLVYFVNSLSANELLKMKMKRIDLLNIRDLEYHADLFEDIIIDNSQALEMSNVYTNILGGTMEAYASIISNNMNIFINRLTIITIILMVPTLVASFYGMNLEHLPFVDNKYAFYVIILISVLLGLILIWFFRRNKQF
jgi:magnesium transporter